ncbi:hypothetical protein [Chondromyces apiculatus]|uniref:Uncharacterized protein n=1 Tax=Chondromyces apiculatus DSM 436 TaxID=1192034 RepID=A0A017TID4_9BACT|nr:hypothetical protein [Chondromyces apiculatus]EYF08391.1 Hypothetical protein CAP_3920 [Chondromyces apiculatus DSM 436]
MSYRVLVIPEDFRKDAMVLQPIVEALFVHLGRKAKVIVCRSLRADTAASPRDR